MEETTERLQVTVEKDILEALDAERGRISRSAYARNLLWKLLVHDKH